MHLAQSKCFFICGELCTYTWVREEGAYILRGVPISWGREKNLLMLQHSQEATVLFFLISQVLINSKCVSLGEWLNGEIFISCAISLHPIKRNCSFVSQHCPDSTHQNWQYWWTNKCRLLRWNWSNLIKSNMLFQLLFNFWKTVLTLTCDDCYMLRYQMSQWGKATSLPSSNGTPAASLSVEASSQALHVSVCEDLRLKSELSAICECI